MCPPSSRLPLYASPPPIHPCAINNGTLVHLNNGGRLDRHTHWNTDWNTRVMWNTERRITDFLPIDGTAIRALSYFLR